MTWKVSLAAAAMLAAATLPSLAQVKLDMNRMTCGTWLNYSPDQQSFVRFWMSGYYNAAANNNVLDYDRMRKNSAKVAAYCKRNKSDTLPTAIKKTIS
jgi:hypothetical protein